MKNDYGESIRLLARCIAESAIKGAWLADLDETRFERFVADGVKAELEVIEHTKATMERVASTKVIGSILLSAIDRAMRLAGVTPKLIQDAKKLPDLASMYSTVGRTRQMYAAAYKLGSHAVHGTWMELVLSYFGDDDGALTLDLSNIPPDPHVLLGIAMFMLDAVRAILLSLFSDNKDAKSLVALSDQAEIGLMDAMATAYPDQFSDAAVEARRRLHTP